MSKLQELNIDAILSTSTTYGSVTQVLTPNDVTYFNKPVADSVVINLSPASGTTIINVTSDQGLTWTQSRTGAPWVSSALAMPAAAAAPNGETPVNITIWIPSSTADEKGIPHDPTFTVKNRPR